jgi:hypothetical protein
MLHLHGVSRLLTKLYPTQGLKDRCATAFPSDSTTPGFERRGNVTRSENVEYRAVVIRLFSSKEQPVSFVGFSTSWQNCAVGEKEGEPRSGGEIDVLLLRIRPHPRTLTSAQRLDTRNKRCQTSI